MDLVLLSFWLELVVPVWDCTEIVNSYLAGWTCEELCSVGPKWKRVLSCNFTPTLSLSLSLSLRSPADVRTPLISTLAPLPCIVVSTPPPQLSRPAEGLFENEQTGEENRQRRGKTKTNQQTKKNKQKKHTKTRVDFRFLPLAAVRRSCVPFILFHFIFALPVVRSQSDSSSQPSPPCPFGSFFSYCLIWISFRFFALFFACVCEPLAQDEWKEKSTVVTFAFFFLWISRCDGSGAIISLTRNRFFFCRRQKRNRQAESVQFFFIYNIRPSKKKNGVPPWRLNPKWRHSVISAQLISAKKLD